MNTSTMNATTLQPKVYVGTYKKYNNGSLKGGWLTLTDYKDYGAFCTACRKLHKDEHDPELMIQDASNMPDGLSVMEWMSEQEFNDIIEAVHAEAMEEEDEAPKFSIIDYSEKAIAVVGDTRDIKEQLKQLGGRFNPRLSCGCGWIFSKAKQTEVEKLLAGGKVEKAKAEKKADNGAAYKQTLAEWYAIHKNDYYKKNSIGAVKLNDGYMLLSKESIDTRFCFHDEGPNYEVYKKVTRDDESLKKYFLAENLRDLDHEIKSLSDEDTIFYVSDLNHGRKSYYCHRDYWHFREREEHVVLTPEQRAEVLKALQWSRGEFEKRLNTYLKRYGVSKIHTWTYWADA